MGFSRTIVRLIDPARRIAGKMARIIGRFFSKKMHGGADACADACVHMCMYMCIYIKKGARHMPNPESRIPNPD